MTSFPDAEYPAALVAEINAHFANDVDYDSVAIEVMGTAPNVEIAFTALLDLAPHLGLTAGPNCE
jgi:spore coat polysaccharide biosynthesis protein SpsF (cytidylyltransferase family)